MTQSAVHCPIFHSIFLWVDVHFRNRSGQQRFYLSIGSSSEAAISPFTTVTGSRSAKINQDTMVSQITLIYNSWKWLVIHVHLQNLEFKNIIPHASVYVHAVYLIPCVVFEIFSLTILSCMFHIHCIEWIAVDWQLENILNLDLFWQTLEKQKFAQNRKQEWQDQGRVGDQYLQKQSLSTAILDQGHSGRWQYTDTYPYFSSLISSLDTSWPAGVWFTVRLSDKRHFLRLSVSQVSTAWESW